MPPGDVVKNRTLPHDGTDDPLNGLDFQSEADTTPVSPESGSCSIVASSFSIFPRMEMVPFMHSTAEAR